MEKLGSVKPDADPYADPDSAAEPSAGAVWRKLMHFLKIAR